MSSRYCECFSLPKMSRDVSGSWDCGGGKRWSQVQSELTVECGVRPGGADGYARRARTRWGSTPGRRRGSSRRCCRHRPECSPRRLRFCNGFGPFPGPTRRDWSRRQPCRNARTVKWADVDQPDFPASSPFVVPHCAAGRSAMDDQARTTEGGRGRTVEGLSRLLGLLLHRSGLFFGDLTPGRATLHPLAGD